MKALAKCQPGRLDSCGPASIILICLGSLAHPRRRANVAPTGPEPIINTVGRSCAAIYLLTAQQTFVFAVDWGPKCSGNERFGQVQSAHSFHSECAKPKPAAFAAVHGCGNGTFVCHRISSCITR